MARFSLILSILLFNIFAASTQSLYYPPLVGSTWQTIDPVSLGWDTTQLAGLRTFLDTTDTRAFMILKDGKIVVEYYFNDHNASKPWYWASAGKSLTSVLVACAEADGKLKLTDATSQYLGADWTSCSTADEQKITIKNQITMTSGLDDSSFDCTEPSCLSCLAYPGTRWAYHNSPYTLLDGVIEAATGQDLNAYLKSRLSDETGINGLYIRSGYNNVFYSTARVMARFGLLVLGNGKWNNKDIIKNPVYVEAMSKSSQNLNKSYGYLWWLNGKQSFMLPGSQIVFPSSLLPDAPADMFAALGKNDQKLYIIPSQNMVILRMGDKGSSDNALVPIVYDAMLWKILNALFKPSSSIEINQQQNWFVQSSKEIVFENAAEIQYVEFMDVSGKKVYAASNGSPVSTSSLPAGLYFIKAQTKQKSILTSPLLWTGQ